VAILEHVLNNLKYAGIKKVYIRYDNAGKNDHIIKQTLKIGYYKSKATLLAIKALTTITKVNIMVWSLVKRRAENLAAIEWWL
jgi:NDP-sugar pyrophosphorylase family protein